MSILIKAEFDKRWANIVSDLQGQLVDQEWRVKYLETRDKRRQTVVDILALGVLKLEINYDALQSVSNQEDPIMTGKRDQINVQKGFLQTNNGSQKTAAQHGIISGRHKKGPEITFLDAKA